MKILLAEAPFSYDEAVVKGSRYYPLGLGYIAAVIRQKPGRDVELFVDGVEPFRRLVQRDPPDVLGLSAMTSSYPTCASLARIAKEANPHCAVIIGGQHATSVGPESVFSEIPDVDFVGLGEGEALMDQFLDELESGECRWDSVPGLCYKTEGGVKSGPDSGLLRELDTMPFPARDLVPLDKFPSHSHMRLGRLTASLVSSRGCPWRCTYCSSFVTMGRKYRYRSAQSVVDEMQEMAERWGVDSYVFWDDVFTAHQKHAFEICAEIRKRNLKVAWWCLSRTDRMTPELAEAMKDAGCEMISFGIESGSRKTLERIRKQVEFDVVAEAVHYCSAAGIRTQGTFILGFPFETRRDFRETIEFAKSLELDVAMFFSFTPYPGTEEWGNVPEEMKPSSIDDWNRFVCNARDSISWNPKFSDQEIATVIARAHREFFLRPRQVWQILRTLRSGRELMGYAQSGVSLLSSLARMKLRRPASREHMNTDAA